MEASAFDEAFAAKLFKGKTVEMPNQRLPRSWRAQAALPAAPAQDGMMEQG